MNKTCADCIHYEACSAGGGLFNEKDESKEMLCGHFKDKSRYIELPCAVGDTVWFDTYKKSGTVCLGIQPHKVDRIDVVVVTDTKSLIETQTYSWEIGKTVFLTKEEAEKALEGMKNA